MCISDLNPYTVAYADAMHMQLGLHVASAACLNTNSHAASLYKVWWECWILEMAAAVARAAVAKWRYTLLTNVFEI